MQQVWLSLHWVLRPGWAGGFLECSFAECWSFPDVEEMPLDNHSAQSPANVRVANPGHAMGHCMQGQMQALQCAAGVVEAALGAEAGLGRWFRRVTVLAFLGVFQLRRRRSPATTAHRALSVYTWPALGMPWDFNVKCSFYII